MPTVEESLAALRGGAAGGPQPSVLSTLASLRASAPPSPSLSFEDQDSYYTAVKEKKVSPGQTVRIGTDLFKAVPRKTGPRGDLSNYTQEEIDRMVAMQPSLGIEPIPGGENVKPSVTESLARLRSGKPASFSSPVREPSVTDLPPEPSLFDSMKGAGPDLAGLAAKGVRAAAAPFTPPQIPTSIGGALEMAAPPGAGLAKNPTVQRYAGDVGAGLANTAAAVPGIVPLVVGPDNKTAKSAIKMAEWWREASREMYPKDANFVDTLVQSAAGSVPYYLVGMGVAAGTGGASVMGPIAVKLAPYVGSGVTGVLEASQNAAQQFMDLREKGMDEKEAVKRADTLFWGNILWNFLINKAGGLFDSAASGVLKKIVMSAPMEGLQEWGQSVMEKFTGQEDGKPFNLIKEAWSNEALMSGAIGTILGAAGGGAQVLASRLSEAEAHLPGGEASKAKVLQTLQQIRGGEDLPGVGQAATVSGPSRFEDLPSKDEFKRLIDDKPDQVYPISDEKSRVAPAGAGSGSGVGVVQPLPVAPVPAADPGAGAVGVVEPAVQQAVGVGRAAQAGAPEPARNTALPAGPGNVQASEGALPGPRPASAQAPKPPQKTSSVTPPAKPPKTVSSEEAVATPIPNLKPPKGKASYEMDSGAEPPSTPAATKTDEDLPPVIEMPEMVEMAEQLLAGKTPKVMESLRKIGARGVFYPGKGEIALSAHIFKDAKGAAKTLAHEIGHARDWLSDKDMAKGNILGRIASVPGYMKSMIEALPDQPGKVLSEAERAKIHSQSIDSILKKKGKTLKQMIADPALNKEIASEVKAIYKERLAEEVGKRGLITRDEIMTELKALNQKWKPFDVDADPKFTAYRYSPEELYADATSVLFNEPSLMKEMAPKFYKSLFAYMGRKPDVKAAYDEIVERIRGGKVEEGREARMEEMFEAGERQAAAERLATEKTARSIVSDLRAEMIDKNEGVLDYVRRAKKAGKVVRPEDSPQYALEEMNYVSSEVKAYLETANEILKELNEKGIPWRRLEHLMFHERVIHERGELANPRGFTPETSQKQLDHARKSLGEDKWKALEAAAKKFRSERMGKIVKMMEESGMFSKELMEKASTNPYYATFDVFSKHAEEAGGPGVGAMIHGQIGTLQEVAGPATSTLMKDVSLIKAMRRNEAAKITVEFLQEHFGPVSIRPAETKWNGKFHQPVAPRDPAKGLISFMEAGKIQSFVVDKWVAKVFERDPIEASAVVRAARVTQRVFREVFTQKNPGFQLFNLWRDYFRAYKNLPGISFAGLTRHYIKALAPAFRRGFDIPDPLIKEMLEKRMLITVEEKWGLSTEDEQVQAVMDRYFGNRAKEDPGLKDKFMELIQWVGNIGSAIEAMPKVAGALYLKENQQRLGLSDKEVAHMIRGQVGSPDFMRKGSGYSWYNNIAMFSNAIKEGWRSDLEVARARPGEYAWKTVKANLVSKSLMLGAAAGLLGAGMKALMDAIPEYDKTNYLVIPLGKTPQGKTVYIRMPQDESGRFLGGLFWKMAMKDLSPYALADYMAGQAPTLNPILGVAGDIAFYAAGKNPYDLFRERNVIPEKEFEAGGWRSHRLFLKHIANSLGAGIVHTFKTNDLEKVKTDMEKGLGFPIVSNIIGRFIKVSDYGKSEMIQREVEKSRKTLARERLDERDAMVMHLNAVDKPGPADAVNLYRDMVKAGMLKRGRGTEVVGLKDFMKEYNRFAEKKAGDPYINAMVYARSNEEKAHLLEYYRRTMPKAEYDAMISQVTREGVLTMKPLALSYVEEKK